MRAALVNSTLALNLLIFAVLLFRWVTRRGTFADSIGVLHAWLTRPGVLLLLGVLSVTNVGYRFYIGLQDPGDFVQDLIAARRVLEGGTLYPPEAEMRELGRWELENADLGLPRPLSDGSQPPRVNAHPPTIAVLLAPSLATLGPHATYVLVVALSILGLMVAMRWITTEQGIHLDGPTRWLAAFALLGWHPIVSIARHAQPSLALTFLVVAAWYALRTGRSALAGISVAFAVSLQMFPGLLLVYLALRERRALAWALSTMALIGAVVLAIVGVDELEAFVGVMRAPSAHFTYARSNPSLSAVLLGFLGSESEQASLARYLPTAVILVTAGGLAALLASCKRASLPALDVEIGIFCVAMILASPVAWYRYFPILLLAVATLGVCVARRRRMHELVLFSGLLCVLSIPDLFINQVYYALRSAIGKTPSWAITSVVTYVLVALLIILVRWRRQLEAAAGVQGQPTSAHA